VSRGVGWGWSRGWELWYRRVLPAYWVYIFCATHFPRPDLPVPFPSEDKVLHFIMYALLAFLYWRCGETVRRPLSGQFVYVAAVVLLSYGAIDEYLQRFVNRGPSVTDWLADAAGALTALGLLEWRRRRAARLGNAAVGQAS